MHFTVLNSAWDSRSVAGIRDGLFEIRIYSLQVLSFALSCRCTEIANSSTRKIVTFRYVPYIYVYS